MTIDWDEWRSKYDEMTYEEHLAFYDEVWAQFPVQKHFTDATMRNFFSYVDHKTPEMRVLEVGGWRGEAAQYIMGFDKRFPKADGTRKIAEWVNYEVCRGAVADNVLKDDPAYRSEVPASWVWELGDEAFEGKNVFVAAHVIEHMRLGQLAELLPRLKDVEFAYVESPLSETPSEWTSYEGSHIIETGWIDVDALFAAHGFEKVHELSTSWVHCYRRSLTQHDGSVQLPDTQ